MSPLTIMTSLLPSISATNPGGVKPDVNTWDLRYLKLGQMTPILPFLRLLSWIKEEWKKYSESCNLTHTLEMLTSFNYLMKILQWLFSSLWTYPLIRRMVPLLPEGVSGRKPAVDWFRVGLRAHLFIWQLQSNSLDSLSLNVFDIVISVVNREKDVFLTGSSGHRWVCAWCKHFNA